MMGIKSKYPMCINGPRRHHNYDHISIISIFLAFTSMKIHVTGEVAMDPHGTWLKSYLTKKANYFTPEHQCLMEPRAQLRSTCGRCYNLGMTFIETSLIAVVVITMRFGIYYSSSPREYITFVAMRVEETHTTVPLSLPGFNSSVT